MKNDFAAIQPADRYAFNIFEAMANLTKYENHEDLLERVNIFEAILYPIITAEESAYPGENEKLNVRVKDMQNNPNPYAIARARLKLLMNEIERAGLIGDGGVGKKRSKKNKIA